MFLKIFIFEIRYRLKRPATYAYFGILFIFALMLGIFGAVPASEKVYVNSPIAIGRILLLFSFFELLISSAIMGVPVYRDIEHQTKDYFFTYPITERSYLLARFLGSFLILVLVSFGTQIGLIIGGPLGVAFGKIEPEHFGPFVPWHYIYYTLVFCLPNLLFTGCLFFALVALTRKILVTYVGCILLLIGYLLANALARDLDNRDLVDMLDPFALLTYNNAVRYWTPSEQNTLLLPLSGNFLINRAIWLGVSAAIFTFTLFRFSFQDMLNKASGKIKKAVAAVAPKPVVTALPIVRKVYSNSAYLKKLFRLSVLEFKNIVQDFYFIAMLLGGVLFLCIDGWFSDGLYGTPSLPLTLNMVEVKDFTYIIFVFIIIIFYTGEVVHRDKSVHYSSISDTLPVPNWVVYGSKFLSLVLISFALINLVMVCGVLNQTIKGYFNYEFSIYFKELYLIGFPKYLELVMLAFIVHIMVNNKFTGHIITIGIWTVLLAVQAFAEQDYNLFFYASTPDHTISDMNGFGHFIKPLFWFNFYWLSLGAVFLIIGNLFWNRGSETDFAVRWKIVKQRFNKTAAVSLTAFTVLWIVAGAFIYYNVSVLNTYRRSKEAILMGVEFEKKYKKYEFTPQPKVTDVKINVELYPDERRTVASGLFTIVNKNKTAIDSLILNIGSAIDHTTIQKIEVDGKALKLLYEDKVNRFFFYQLPRAMKPMDTMKLDITMDARYEGFRNSGTGREIVYNGTFFDLSVFPSFGYPGDPISSDAERKKNNLPKKDYVSPPQTDARGLSTLLFNDDGDYVTFEAIIGTIPGQIAIAPGYLQKEWESNGRKYYQYKMEGEMDLFFNISSARYEVTRDVWNGKSGEKVNIEIFHDAKHPYNIDRFVKSAKASLDYYATNFRPYQYHQIRILEFPRYANFAQSFPNTVPFSESFGWVADFSNPDKTDYAFYVTAHEIAHQWWGHQVTPSATRGANQISESMAEYSALMVLQKEYGQESMQKFLKYDLDSYLRGRASEGKFEATLLDNDSRAYVWYRKGSLVLYALQDLIGEKTLNEGFRKFIDSAAFRTKPPFPTSNEWYGYIKRATPDSMHYFLEDSFEKITLYENSAVKATYEPVGNKFKVTLTVKTKKIHYDGLGKELDEGKVRELIEIGIFDEDKKTAKGLTQKVPLYLKKQWLMPGEHTIEITVDKKPVKAGIDPYNKLIDRIPDDNLKTVSLK